MTKLEFIDIFNLQIIYMTKEKDFLNLHDKKHFTCQINFRF